MKILLLVPLSLVFLMCSSDYKPQQEEEIASVEDSLSVVVEETIIEENEYQCDYFNEPEPDSIPKLFSKGFISSSVDEYCFEINKYGNEVIVDRAGVVLIASQKNGVWSDLEVAPFSGKYTDGECCLSPDGEKIYFGSRRTLAGAKGSFNTWVSEKKDGVWQEPYPLKSPVWDQTTHAISVSNSGSVYSSGVTVFRKNEETYASEARLSSRIEGTHPYIAPDESYIIFRAKLEGRWDKDLFISFNNNDTWSEPILLNEHINTKAKESNPFVTPDGKFLFFTRQNDVFWVKFDFLEELKSRAKY